MHPHLIRIPMPFGLGPLTIAAYGTMVALGALVGIYVASVRARRLGLDPNIILDLALVLLISGLLGARIFYFVFDAASELRGKSIGAILKRFINFPSGGLSFYGALALGIPAGLLFLHKRMKNIWLGADVAIPSIALGIAFARIGCFLNGCCFGRECSPSFPLAQEFPYDSYPAQFYLAHGATHWPIPIYPTQLIESAYALVIFIVLTILFARRRFDGQLFCLFGILYGVARFLNEFLRADNPRNVFGAITTWQLAALLLAAGCVVLWIVLQRRARAKAALGK